MDDSIRYRADQKPTLAELTELYRHCALGQWRPIDDPDAMQKMIDHAPLFITAWSGNQLVGVARTLTDFSFVAYLADLAVHQDYQRHKIGKELIHQTRAALGPKCFITLLAADSANEYYPRRGFKHNAKAWNLWPNDPLL